ncbi:MAG: 5-oxoprolinase subunit PxpB [Spirochaetales bacterium]|nr:5-oxoprolinase subunit PxpB [Spirochaetales bacterium]
MRKYPLGDSCLCWSLDDKIDPAVSARILSVYRELKDTAPGTLGIRDFVPSYNALAVHFDPLKCDRKKLEELVDEAFAKESGGNNTGKEVIIPVKYDGEDLDRVAELHDLTVREVIDLHSKGNFTVAMVGFLPNFPYLIGLDERLVTPRLDSPRTKVPAGSVAIGGAQTGIYPVESPGGWNLIGSTDPALLQAIEPGDRVIFEEMK